MLILYRVLFFFLWPLIFLGFIWRYGLRRTLAGLPERWGWGGRWPRGPGALWVHAASVGEVRAAEPFLRALPERFPGVPRLLTTTTVTGKELAERLGVADVVRLAPVDRPGPVRRLLNRVRPRAVVLIETELWPLWLRTLARERVPVTVVNGRISDGAFPLYRRLRPLWAPLLAGLTRVGVQSPRNADRFLQLGVRPERVTITGNIKFDLPLPDPARRPALRRVYGFGDAEDIWVLGSTHAGEEALAREVFAALRRDRPGLKLVAAPRHVERAVEVRRLFTEGGFRTVLRSALSSVPGPFDVLVLDTVGELAEVYGLATVAYVGGSLVGRGGQNPLEPARWGVPLVYGPRMENFREIDEALRAAGAARTVSDAVSLTTAVGQLLGSAGERARLGGAARAVADGQRGALEASLRLLAETLAPASDPTTSAVRCGSR